MNFYQPARYIEYLVTSGHRGGHGIHSPFVFDLVSGIFRNKSASDVVCSIELIRKKLEHNNRLITVNDLGTGLAKGMKRERKVSDIAKRSAIPQRYGRLLLNLSEAFAGNSVIELGTSLGISTMYLAAGAPGSIVYTIEGCPECSAIATGNFSSSGFSNIKPLTGSFEEHLSSLTRENINPGLIFIDGNHSREPVLRYFNELLQISSSDTVFVFDDIHSSAEMGEAWDTIKNDKRVTASVDIFRMGLVFLKPGITRNHYVVRY